MTENSQQTSFILKGELRQVMWSLSWPAIAAMVLFGLNAFMDTVYIGQLMNETALAGVALAYPLTAIMMGLGSWAGTGAGNLISIALGKGDLAAQESALPNATLFIIISSIIFAVPAYIFAEELIQMMGGSGEVLAYGTTYLRVALLAAPLWIYGLSLNFIIRAEGKMKAAAIMMSYGLVLNLILSPIFIDFFHLGVAGAAWATNLGMLVYCIVGYRYFSGDQPSFRANIHRLSYAPSQMCKILQLGFPGFIMTIMSLLQAIVVFNAIVLVGTESDLAFFAAANRMVLFLMTPLFGLMRALQPVVGLNYGAGQYERSEAAMRLFTKTGFYLIAPIWLLLTLFPGAGLSLVLPDSIFSATDLWHFRIYILVLPALPFVFMSLTYLPAIEQPKYASIIGLARQLVFYVPVMLFLPRWIGIGGIYYGATAIDLIITVWLVYIVWRSFSQLRGRQAMIPPAAPV